MKYTIIILLLVSSCVGISDDYVLADIHIIFYDGRQQDIHVKRWAFHPMDSYRHFFLDDGCVKYASSHDIISGWPCIVCGVSSMEIRNFKRSKS